MEGVLRCRKRITLNMHSMHSMQNMCCAVVYVFERYKQNTYYSLEYAFYAKYGGGAPALYMFLKDISKTRITCICILCIHV